MRTSVVARLDLPSSTESGIAVLIDNAYSLLRL